MFGLIEQWKNGNQTTVSFCSEHGLSTSNLYYWLKKYRQSQSPAPKGFIPLQVEPQPSMEVEVHYKNGVFLRLQSVDLSMIKSLIRLG